MWIFNLFKKEDDNDKKDVEKWVAKAIDAIAEEIAAGEQQIRRVQEHHQELLQKLADFEREANKLEEAAKQAIKEGQEQLARGYLMRRQTIVPQIEEYRKMCEEIEGTIQRLVQRQARQQVKLEKLKAKQATLSVELKQVQSMQKANEYWQQVMEELGFAEDAYLMEEAQLRLQQGEEADLAAFDEQLHTPQTSSVEDLKAAIRREEQQKQLEEQRKQEEQLYKRISVLLTNAESKANKIRQTQEEERKKQREELLDTFFKNNQDQKVKKTIEQFFRDNPEELSPGQEPQQAEQTKKTSTLDDKEAMIRAFFNRTSGQKTEAKDPVKNTNEDLKKQIEDFFNKKKED